ncbi:neuroguidin [Contarinia nasturtii]|uniref:neuroguidin n=1 Tax=Contarinia nasturtii TaxID=265458 RepID=UPI0012D4AF46|nr:neuroguidin [Contarinia nasturtii]XP_031624959.1 neuroguidin [Contarinia nasturtii]
MVQALDDYEIEEDLPNAMKLLGEMNNNVKQVSDLVEGMLQRVKSGELTTEYGLSFLEVRYHMLLTYLINLTYVVLRKCSGKTIERDPSIDRLIEIRTVLEKIRPIDYKLRYQIDKLVKTAITGVTNSKDPINFKPNLSALTTQIETGDTAESSDDSNDSDDEANKSGKNGKKSASTKDGGVYVPPKLSAVHYDGEDTKAERARKQIERARKRALNSNIIQDLKEECLDTPTEITEGSRAQQLLTRAQKEKEEYEEAYLTRLPVTKAEKHRQRKLTTLGTLGDEITSFGNISALSGSASGSLPKGKKRKSKGQSKRRGGKKRKFH